MSQPKIVAIVDDDALVLSAMSSLVRSLGYAVLTFASAEALLACPVLARLACLISDIQLPGGMNGFELQSALRMQHRSCPVILMTGLSDEGTRARALRSDALAFMQKPVATEDLAKCLVHACETDTRE